MTPMKRFWLKVDHESADRPIPLALLEASLLVAEQRAAEGRASGDWMKLHQATVTAGELRRRIAASL